VVPASQSSPRILSPRASLSSPEALLSSSGSPAPVKKISSPATRSGIPRPNSTSKLPVQRKSLQQDDLPTQALHQKHSGSNGGGVLPSRPVDSSWREGCF
jgi:hypothetical protein